MPTIFDNIDTPLLNELIASLGESHRADFCVGYFNLRGFAPFQEIIEAWPPQQMRLLIGMQQSPSEELRAHLNGQEIDQATAKRLMGSLVKDFHQQLTFGTPTNRDEANLRKLARLLREKKVTIKLHLAHPLHAKLYLLHRNDRITPLVGYLGSSNLTISGLRYQGELNVDVLEQDAANKLSNWFEDRWNHPLSRDISEQLAEVIEQSWARPQTLSPYHIYLKIAYHLSQEARMGLSEFTIPKDLRSTLLDFQGAAVRIAANHLYKRGGVIIGDVVGLGKSLMATALARILQDDTASDTLIICPPKLKRMWQDYADKYRLIARILSIGEVDELAEMRRYRLVLIDESHNLRNPEGKRYKAIRDYIEANECKVILLTATPYNKNFTDISAQLRLFVDHDAPLSVRPESLIQAMGGQAQFSQAHQVDTNTIAAFEKSEYADDWRDLLRLFMVRRTRSFIINNYAEKDNRGAFIRFSDGNKSYFPKRTAKTIPVATLENDPYEQLYNDRVVNLISELSLPRYGLINYIDKKKEVQATEAERAVIKNLSKVGKRLIGFTRSGLFKRLESSGHSFLLSVRRHILRNMVFEHAIANNLPIPIGGYNVEALSANESDLDQEKLFEIDFTDDETILADSDSDSDSSEILSLNQQTAINIYQNMQLNPRKFRWIRSEMFLPGLALALKRDRERLETLLAEVGEWDASKDSKLLALAELLKNNGAQTASSPTPRGPAKKILLFSAYADTVMYLERELKKMGFRRLAAATAAAKDPTYLAWRFSPISNKQNIAKEEELDILLATDVLSEGQNLQDAYQVVNFDLPWAIIRLIQRAGRVDRIGQQAEEIFCYSFLPAQGVENIIGLRKRLSQRLKQNGEVVGQDEAIFEDEDVVRIQDLYSEKAGTIDGEENEEVDLSSYAFQIWSKAQKEHPKIAEEVERLPPVVYSAKASENKGAIVYLKTSDDNDTLAYVDPSGNLESTSQLRILHLAQCSPSTPSQDRSEEHHQLVANTLQTLASTTTHGQLGRPSSARYKAVTRLTNYLKGQGPLFKDGELEKAINLMNRYPLTESAKASIARQIKLGIRDAELGELVVALMQDERLCVIKQEEGEASIICSLSLV